MSFDRQGYLKTIYETTFLDKWMTSALLYMAAYCAEDMSVKRSACEATKICEAIRCSEPMARLAIKKLKTAKLITLFKRRRLLHYRLPSETQLSKYLPPEDDKEAT